MMVNWWGFRSKDQQQVSKSCSCLQKQVWEKKSWTRVTMESSIVSFQISLSLNCDALSSRNSPGTEGHILKGRPCMEKVPFKWNSAKYRFNPWPWLLCPAPWGEVIVYRWWTSLSDGHITTMPLMQWRPCHDPKVIVLASFSHYVMAAIAHWCAIFLWCLGCVQLTLCAMHGYREEIQDYLVLRSHFVMFLSKKFASLAKMLNATVAW